MEKPKTMYLKSRWLKVPQGWKKTKLTIAKQDHRSIQLEAARAELKTVAQPRAHTRTHYGGIIRTGG